MFRVKQFSSFVTLLVFVTCSGCIPPKKVDPPKTQLQMRQFQTRSYSSRNLKTVMKAILNALQDEGYIIKSADLELGFISASKDVDVEDTATAFLSRLLAGRDARYQKNAILDVSANVTEFGDETRVRIIFQTRILDNYGSPMTASQVDDEKFYQEFFAKVDKSLFLENERI